MTGNLGLSSPWARQALPDPLRSELRALVPDGWTVGLSVKPNRGGYTAWANDDRTGANAVHIAAAHTAEGAIRAVIAWIERESIGRGTWTEATDGWVVAPLVWKGTLDAAG